MARTVTRSGATRRRAADPTGKADPSKEDAPSVPTRVEAIDALRGIALGMMFVYHFAFDLRYFGVARLDFEHDTFWLSFRAIIVSMFLVLVGVSIVLADRHGTTLARFLRRLAVIAAGALAATAASIALFPSSFIYFGILHCIVITSLLAWPVRRRPVLALAIGGALLLAGFLYASPMFDPLYLSWIGFTTQKPVTEDYVPLVPWAAAVFVGIAFGHGLTSQAFEVVRAFGGAPRAVRWLGRHSLLVYLLHQPIFIGVLWLAVGR